MCLRFNTKILNHYDETSETTRDGMTPAPPVNLLQRSSRTTQTRNPRCRRSRRPRRTQIRTHSIHRGPKHTNRTSTSEPTCIPMRLASRAAHAWALSSGLSTVLGSGSTSETIERRGEGTRQPILVAQPSSDCSLRVWLGKKGAVGGTGRYELDDLVYIVT